VRFLCQIEFSCQKWYRFKGESRAESAATALGSITAAKWIVNKIETQKRRQTEFNTLSNCQLSHTHTLSVDPGCSRMGRTFIICANICQKWQLAVVSCPARVAGPTLLGILVQVLSRLVPALSHYPHPATRSTKWKLFYTQTLVQTNPAVHIS